MPAEVLNFFVLKILVHSPKFDSLPIVCVCVCMHVHIYIYMIYLYKLYMCKLLIIFMSPGIVSEV
jgi:hypothetical protein